MLPLPVIQFVYFDLDISIEEFAKFKNEKREQTLLQDPWTFTTGVIDAAYAAAIKDKKKLNRRVQVSYLPV